MNTYEGGSCAMYAFEKEIPKISQTKLDGMAKFYGMSSDNATEYFKLHTEADIRHAAAWQNILETASTNTNDLIQIADKSISAQNLLLDSCYEAYC
jgi:pyrroloquinoline-quinone synthase